MDKENGDNGGDKNKGGQPDPNSLLDAASLFGMCRLYRLYLLRFVTHVTCNS